MLRVTSLPKVNPCENNSTAPPTHCSQKRHFELRGQEHRDGQVALCACLQNPYRPIQQRQQGQPGQLLGSLQAGGQMKVGEKKQMGTPGFHH